MCKERTLAAIVGPTATGKTAVGIELAKLINAEIISADSMAVYKGMDIGTAKPTAAEQKQARFHLIDVVCPDQDFSVAEFQRLSLECIGDIYKRECLPVVVGGTGLYVKSLTDGLNIPIAPPDKEFRKQLLETAERDGRRALMNQLAEVDPETAARLHENDLKRIIRALEVYRQTGTPISAFHKAGRAAELPYKIRMFGLTISRPHLYERINRRVDEQIEEGLVEEVKHLLDCGYSPNLPSMRGLGYKQIAGYLEGQYNLETAVDLLKRDTSRFAKRQFTWFKAEPRILWVDTLNRTAADMAREIAGLLGRV
jgi:tRNA dimethylallyltransferase